MTYRLTSPHMHGPGIRELQEHLKGDNPWKKNYRPGILDGVYGQGTAGAVQRAKRDLGWPKRKCTPVAGATFLAVISGKRKLPRAYALRRRMLADRAEKGRRLRAAIVAQTRREIERGLSEQPAGSNRVLYSEWYGMIGAWCAMFVTWVVIKAAAKAGIGQKSFARGQRFAYVPYIRMAAVSRKYGLSVIAEPQPGDIPLYDWDGDNIEDHVGILLEWHDSKRRNFTAGEGNTDYGNNSNGGKVMKRKDRTRSQTTCFVRVGV